MLPKLKPKYSKKGSYSTKFRLPSWKTERRLVLPPVTKRPVRFTLRSLIRQPLIWSNPWWLVIHRRGISRPHVGLDPLEARAVPHDQIRGTLPERILYKSLTEEWRFVDGIDFNFQSSLQGGRIDTGGIVADFLFPFLKIIINPLGPTHYEYMRMLKDTEQIMALEEMGYTVYMVDEHVVYDEFQFDNWMRETLNWVHTGAQMAPPQFDAQESNSGFMADKVVTSLMELSDYIHTGVY